MKAAEAPKSTTYPAFRFRKAIATDTEAERKAGYVAKLFDTAEDEQAAEDAEPGVHNWFNNPGLKEEKPNATVADVQSDMAAQIQQLTSDLESANATIGIQDKQIASLNAQIAELDGKKGNGKK